MARYSYPTYQTPYNQLLKLNEDFKFTEKLREYAMNPVWKDEYSTLWTIVSGSSENMGRTVYEHIANYVQNVSDIDTCGLSQLYSIATELDVADIFSYNLQYPVGLERLMNLLSIGRSYLLTSGYVLEDATLDSMYTSLSGISGDISDSDYISGILEPVLSGHLTYYANFSTSDPSLSGTAEDYRGFMDDIYSDPASEYGVTTSALIIDECTHVLRNICIKASYQRETLKTIARKHAMIGTNRAVEKIVAEYILRSFTKKSDWRLHVIPSGDTAAPGINSQYVLEQYVPHISGISNYFNIDVIEYYDTTEYLNISAHTPPVCGTVGYTTGTMVSSIVTTEGYIETGEYYTTGIPVYDIVSASMVQGGNSRFWEGDMLYDNITDSEHTCAEVESYYRNIGLAEYYTDSFNILTAIYDNYAVSGFDRYAYIPDLTGTLSPEASGITGTIPLSAYSTLPTDMVPIHRKYIGTETSGVNPPANIKNSLYPTIAPQPFIWNLIEKAYEEFPEIIRIILMSEQANEAFFDESVDISGNTIDSWKYFNHEFVGYDTYYEHSTNLDYREDMVPEVDRDGPFDVDALSALICDFGNISGRYAHIERNFDISGTMPVIDDQLDFFRNDIINLSASVIYQYSWDQYDNHYFLYKDDDEYNASGTMWMRYRNHPLPFPLSYGGYGDREIQQLYTRGLTGMTDMMNGKTYDFDIVGSHMWMLGHDDISGSMIYVTRNDYVDFTSDPNIGREIFAVVVAGIGNEAPRKMAVTGGVNSFIGVYEYNEYLVFVTCDGTSASVAYPGRYVITFRFAYYSRKTSMFENVFVPGASIDNVADIYDPGDGRRVFRMAVSEDLVTIAYESSNGLYPAVDYVNGITTVDMPKAMTSDANIVTMEFNDVFNGVL